jgi:uncharacterized Zn finger protein (UPF0148 family)
MIRRLLEKWFGLESNVCPVCEVLREQLHKSESERKELLQRALAPPSQPIEPETKEEFKPLTPQFVPWRVRQQMLEAEDRQKAHLMKEKAKEIAELEKELEIK